MFEYLKHLADSILGRPPKEKPRPPTMGRRVTNLLRNNFKGLIGTIVPIIVLPWEFKRYSPSAKTGVMWKLMFWFLFVQPVNIPVSSLIPIFFLPLMGIMSSTKTCQCYMNENILLYLLSGMLLLLLSNAGFDRRLALWFLASGRARQYSPRMLLFKVCMAAFVMSMFCNRLLVTSILCQHVNSAMAHMQLYLKVKPTPKKKPKVKEVIHVNFEELRYILNCAIQTSAGIGSIAIMHCTYTTVYFRAIFAESSSKFEEYPDIFNYLQYSAFAYPVACTAIVFNLAYFMTILTVVIKPQLPHRFLEELRKTFEKYRSKIPRICSKHERLAILFTMIYLICFFCRFSFFHTGWADYRMDEFSPTIARVKDATTAAIFVLLLHTIPRSYGFLTYIDADKKSELPPCKPESAILFWRYVDTNTNYGYMFLFGSGIALQHAIRVSGLQRELGENLGALITNRPWFIGLLIVCVISGILCNIMPGVAACTVFCPFVLNMSVDAVLPWPIKSYVAALGVGIGTAFGFCFPFRYTPAYFCHYTGRVPVLKMVSMAFMVQFIYSFPSVWICILTLWAYLVIYAPVIFDPEQEGILPANAPLDSGGTTPKPEELMFQM